MAPVYFVIGLFEFGLICKQEFITGLFFIRVACLPMPSQRSRHTSTCTLKLTTISSLVCCKRPLKFRNNVTPGLNRRGNTSLSDHKASFCKKLFQSFVIIITYACAAASIFLFSVHFMQNRWNIN